MKNVIRRKPFLIPVFIIIGVAAIALFGWVVMSLWNAALVPATGAAVITFWQGLGLLVLGRILVGGFGGGRHRRGNNWRGKWMSMTPEERAKFKEEWQQRGKKCYDEETDAEKAPGA